MGKFRSEAYFPHYCKNCGLVEANIAKAERTGKGPLCPKCGSKAILQYGKEGTCLPVEDNDVAFTWYSYQAMEYGNLCPSCKEMTLVFDRIPSVLFD